MFKKHKDVNLRDSNWTMIKLLIVALKLPVSVLPKYYAEMKTAIVSGLKFRLLNFFWMTPAMNAISVDPCYKNLRFLSE